MGKVKKPASASKENGQKKISSFFQQPAETTKPKSLFTEHGPQSEMSKFQTSGAVIISDDSDDFRNGKSNITKYQNNFSERGLAGKIDIEAGNGKRRNGPLDNKITKFSNSVSSMSQSAVTCIPETQVIFTPPSLKKGKVDTDELKEATDFGLIPDTPQGKQEEEVKSKRPLGRSFLLSTTQIGSNPIQKAKEHRDAKLALKKKASHARKGLLSVSVQFNPEESEAFKNNTSKQETDSTGNGHLTLMKNEISNTENSSKGHLTDEESLQDNETPTKVYSDGISIKRMSKSGISPDSKRVVPINADNHEKCTGSDITPVSIKKQLSFPENVNTGSIGVVKENNINECIDTGRANVSNSAVKFQSAKVVLGSQSAVLSKEQKLRLERKRMKEEEQKLRQREKDLEKQRVAREEKRRKSEKLMKYQLTGVTENEGKYEGNISVMEDDALDDILQELTSPSLIRQSKNKKPVVVSTDSKGLEFTKTKPLNKRPAEKVPQSRCIADLDKKNEEEEMKGKENYVAADDWTEEDDAYFSKLGVQTDVTATEKQNHKEQDEDIEIEHYLTPCNLATGRSRTPTLEVEIEEFVTQQVDNNFLCDQMEGLSPFKKNSDTAVYVGQTVAPCSGYGRYVVTKVDHSSVEHQIVLDVYSQEGNVNRKCVLSGFWLDSHIEEGDTVHILAEFTDNVCYITDKSGLLVINPDLLLSGTTVVSSVFCMRKSILKEKFKGCDSRNIQMLYGSIIHTVFQQMLKKRLSTAEDIIKEATTIVKQQSNLLEMYANQVTEDKVMEEIKSYIPQMISWLSQYTSLGAHNSARKESQSDVVVTDVCDIEENMWSPRYGVKGKIDLTVKVKVKGEPGLAVLPLELKTGRTSYSVEHKGQVTLYSMMSGDRRKDPGKGLLLYLKEPSMKIIPADHLHQKGLIQLRNEMAYYISRQVIKSADDNGEKTFSLGRLPDPISNTRACQKCPQLINCSIYQRHVEGRSSDLGTLSGLVNETLGHLTSDHMTYFVQWCLMLDLETQLDQSKKTLADIWCKGSRKREEEGLCLSGMCLQSRSCDDVGQDAVILTFSRQALYSGQRQLSSGGITVQDSIVISREDPAWVAVCTGFVHNITSFSIDILTERESCDRLLGMKESVFRIDKCDSFSTAGILYTNVSRLMSDDPHSQKLRRLIIDKVKPEFINTLSKGNIEKVKCIFKSLNKPQKTAILKVLMCKDYVLIRGFPGTGKTSTIVALVKVLCELGLSVLLTSYTHSAVDNILIKLKKDGVKFLRIGRVAKVHSDIRQFTMESLAKGISTTSELEKFFNSQKILATSCLGMNHPLFTQRQFDVCIVDEASQVLQPACLGPLFSSKKFVLVGDPKQLPPVVQCKESRELGMDESLFCRLDGLGATFDLNVQYRMNREIMGISNTLVYNGCLKCGSDTVANQTLVIQKSDETLEILKHAQWMELIFDDRLCKSVIVLDTRRLGANHIQVKTGGYRNEIEAKIVENIIAGLFSVCIQCCDIGVIAPYRSQVLHIRDRLGQGQMMSEVEVNTVDQYQGRDKDVIIISFVMSSNEKTGKVGELLQDIRRLNVAVTRAKKKLILIGNMQTLSQYTHLRQVLGLLDTSNITVLEALRVA